LDAFGKNLMNCEQMEAIVFDLDRDDSPNSPERAAAMAHLAQCPRCAALQQSWQAAKEELRALGEETQEASAPTRVEMRLRQEFRTRHRTIAARRNAIVAAWVLAAAAFVISAVSWWNWQESRHIAVAKQPVAVPGAPSVGETSPAQSQEQDTLSAGLSSAEELGEFTPLPGTVPEDIEQAGILHVRMQRGSLGALGLPVDEQRAGDWIQVDLLVGNDGLPEAVRLTQEED
jgi:hypothetical protein